MINVNELRIDNWVNDPKFGNRQVYGIELHGSGETLLYLSRDGMEFKHRYKIDKVEPIFLTPEILEKCGFNKIGESWHTLNYELPIKTIGDDEVLSIELHSPPHNNIMLYGNARVPGRFEYFHQLQNLYFALTGEELNVQL